jgi:hypothetical protein
MPEGCLKKMQFLLLLLETQPEIIPLFLIWNSFKRGCFCAVHCCCGVIWSLEVECKGSSIRQPTGRVMAKNRQCTFFSRLENAVHSD